MEWSSATSFFYFGYKFLQTTLFWLKLGFFFTEHTLWYNQMQIWISVLLASGLAAGPLGGEVGASLGS